MEADHHSLSPDELRHRSPALSLSSSPDIGALQVHNHHYIIQKCLSSDLWVMKEGDNDNSSNKQTKPSGKVVYCSSCSSHSVILLLSELEFVCPSISTWDFFLPPNLSLPFNHTSANASSKYLIDLTFLLWHTLWSSPSKCHYFSGLPILVVVQHDYLVLTIFASMQC